MKLSKRLDEIQKLIDDNSIVIDVGCDHALLDIYLTLNRKNIKCMACDINKNALEIATKNIKKYNLEDKIQTILCDGLLDVEIDFNSIIVISGMGGTTIKHILSIQKVDKAKKIIIQSNNENDVIRKFMVNKGYYIFDEKYVNERQKDYVIIVFEKGIKKYSNFELEYGPVLIKNKDENIDYFKNMLEKEKNKYHKIPFKYFKLKINTLIKIMYLTRKM